MAEKKYVHPNHLCLLGETKGKVSIEFNDCMEAILLRKDIKPLQTTLTTNDGKLLKQKGANEMKASTFLSLTNHTQINKANNSQVSNTDVKKPIRFNNSSPNGVKLNDSSCSLPADEVINVDDDININEDNRPTMDTVVVDQGDSSVSESDSIIGDSDIFDQITRVRLNLKVPSCITITPITNGGRNKKDEKERKNKEDNERKEKAENQGMIKELKEEDEEREKDRIAMVKKLKGFHKNIHGVISKNKIVMREVKEEPVDECDDDILEETNDQYICTQTENDNLIYNQYNDNEYIESTKINNESVQVQEGYIGFQRQSIEQQSQKAEEAEKQRVVEAEIQRSKEAEKQRADEIISRKVKEAEMKRVKYHVEFGRLKNESIKIVKEIENTQLMITRKRGPKVEEKLKESYVSKNVSTKLRPQIKYSGSSSSSASLTSIENPPIRLLENIIYEISSTEQDTISVIAYDNKNNLYAQKCSLPRGLKKKYFNTNDNSKRNTTSNTLHENKDNIDRNQFTLTMVIKNLDRKDIDIPRTCTSSFKQKIISETTTSKQDQDNLAAIIPKETVGTKTIGSTSTHPDHETTRSKSPPKTIFHKQTFNDINCDKTLVSPVVRSSTSQIPLHKVHQRSVNNFIKQQEIKPTHNQIQKQILTTTQLDKPPPTKRGRKRRIDVQNGKQESNRRNKTSQNVAKSNTSIKEAEPPAKRTRMSLRRGCKNDSVNNYAPPSSTTVEPRQYKKQFVEKTHNQIQKQILTATQLDKPPPKKRGRKRRIDVQNGKQESNRRNKTSQNVAKSNTSIKEAEPPAKRTRMSLRRGCKNDSVNNYAPPSSTTVEPRQYKKQFVEKTHNQIQKQILTATQLDKPPPKKRGRKSRIDVQNGKQESNRRNKTSQNVAKSNTSIKEAEPPAKRTRMSLRRGCKNNSVNNYAQPSSTTVEPRQYKKQFVEKSNENSETCKRLMKFVFNNLCEKSKHISTLNKEVTGILSPYIDVIKRPVELQDIKRKIAAGEITNLTELQSNLFILSHNALMMNRPDSTVSSDAIKFQFELQNNCLELKDAIDALDGSSKDGRMKKLDYSIN